MSALTVTLAVLAVGVLLCACFLRGAAEGSHRIPPKED